jgi:soluble P-type ATPase
MITLNIPGRELLNLEYLLVDFNGTVATDGALLPEVASYFEALSEHLAIYVVTADTFGTVERQCDPLPVKVYKLRGGEEAAEKRALVENLGSSGVVAIGNGRNDVAMLGAAALSMAVLGDEGLSSEALLNAHVVVKDVEDALALLLKPKRLIATLRA